MGLFNKTPKILVEIVNGVYPRRKKCVIDGSHVIIEPGKSGRGGAAQKAEFTPNCLVPYYAGIPPFKSIKHKLILKEGATKCVSFAKPEDYLAPTCTKSDVSHYGEATVIKLSGSLKGENRMFVYILLGIIIILNVVGLLVASGNVRF